MRLLAWQPWGVTAHASQDTGQDASHDAGSDVPPFRYDAKLANEIELAWQRRWDDAGIYEVDSLPGGGGSANRAKKLFIMDMFPYPSGSGLHVGHPLGYIGTDVLCRFKRMNGYAVLHTMGYDAFGLPAEEHARQTGEHPRTNTERNVATMSVQLARLGLGHDRRRSIVTADRDYYRWTQWIFLLIFNSYYDADVDAARPISELERKLEAGERTAAGSKPWVEMSHTERRVELDSHRLAYLAEVPVNWCPALGTVLSAEEVTSEGRSERGNHPVFKRPLKQWMMRITAYADRLLADLERLDWTESVKAMQRNWIGRSAGATVRFPVAGPRDPHADDPHSGNPQAGDATASQFAYGAIDVFTTRPDTIFGTTSMVLAPEHPLVDELVATSWPAGTPRAWTGDAASPTDAVAAYRAQSAQMSDYDRAGDRDKTGVYIGADCLVPTNGARIPIFVADYVLMGYGTGAVMSVPGEDDRDWAFAKTFGIDIVRTVAPPDDFAGDAYSGEGPTINSGFLNGLSNDEAKATIIDWLAEHGYGEATVTYKLRDWLFSRQRYWGEPFPIVFDETGLPLAVPEHELPVELPELIDWAPRPADVDAEPEPPLGRSDGWTEATYDLGDGERSYARELNTMPNWAGSCWYYLRYLDPNNPDRVVDPDIERFWMSDPDDPEEGVGGVDLYVGGVEHAVLHLLYSRFWHKVLYDLGYVSGVEPFKRLYNQGYILAAAYQDSRGVYVDAASVVERDGRFYSGDTPVTQSFGKMGKSLKNAVAPDEIYASYGADTLRLYEMFMGPLDADRPWETRSVVGSHRLLQRIWRNLVDEETGELTVTDTEPPEDLQRAAHRTIAAVAEAMDALKFNSAVARVSELTNELSRRAEPVPRQIADIVVRLIAPLVPHIAEELWAKLNGTDLTTLGHDRAYAKQHSVVFAPFPQADPALLVADTVEVPLQINGKLRSKITVAADADEAALEAAALADERIVALTQGKQINRVVVVPSKLVNIVLG